MSRVLLGFVFLGSIGLALLLTIGGDDGSDEPGPPARWYLGAVVERGGEAVEARPPQTRARSFVIEIDPRNCWIAEREPARRVAVEEHDDTVVVTAYVERAQYEGDPPACESHYLARVQFDTPLGTRSLLVGGFGEPFEATRR